jgi:homogentisate phytyltransferase/homogentisate geranylgeranyltransferase
MGTTVSIVSLQILALGLGQTWDRDTWGELLITWIACLGANVAIVGVNQIIDVDIDRVNKPDLPLPAGLITSHQAWLITAISAVVGLSLSALADIYLLAVVSLSLLIGFAYSVPPLRWKRYALWAGIAIIAVRGSIVNLGLFWHFTGRVHLPPVIAMITMFMVIFGLVIALAKDAPDTTGDRAFGIQTVALGWGATTVLQGTGWLLTGLYTIGAVVSYGLNAQLLSMGLGVCGLVVWEQTRRIASTQDLCPQAMKNFYQFIWRMFYVSYGIFPLGLIT